MYTHILVPLDDSKTSQAGLREALTLARDQGAMVRVVHVLDPSAAAIEMLTAAEFSSVQDDLQLRAKALLGRARRMARRREVPCETVLREGGGQRVADVVLDEAKSSHCDLVVMGTYGRRGLQHAVMGSTAEGVLRRAAVPLLLVKPPQ